MVENENFKNSSHFLLLKTMLEEHDYLKEDIYKYVKSQMTKMRVKSELKL